MDAFIVGTGQDERDSLLFHSEALNEGLPVFSLAESRYRKGGAFKTAKSEVRVHLTDLNDDQLNAFIMSVEDLGESAHELLSGRLLAKRRGEDEIEDEIAKKEAMVEHPPREGDRYAH